MNFTVTSSWCNPDWFEYFVPALIPECCFIKKNAVHLLNEISLQYGSFVFFCNQHVKCYNGTGMQWYDDDVIYVYNYCIGPDCNL